jgi:hypothetical protein
LFTVRLTPDRGRIVDIVEGPSRANNGSGHLSFDHLAGAGEQGVWNGQSKPLGSFEVDHEFILGRRLHRKVRRLLAPEDAVYVAGSAPVRINSFRLSIP